MKRPSRKCSLITEPAQLRLPKLNESFIQKNEDKAGKKDKFFVRPQMKKILFSPFESDNKTEKHHLMVDSCIANKSYQEIADENIENKIKQYFNELKGVQEGRRSCRFLKNKALVGKQAPMSYYGEYKKLSQLKEQATANKQNYRDSPYLAMLDEISKKQLLPMCLGLIKYKGDVSVINLNNYNLGDEYISAMSAGLRQAKLIEKCFVSGNRITDKGMKELVSNLNQEIIVLDLSCNKIQNLDDKLMELIVGPESRLEILNLERNQINRKETIETLLNSTMFSKHLKVLDIRANGISVESAQKICELMETECAVQQLYIGSNFITSKGGEAIFECLSKNKTIKIFDYSLNHLGQESHDGCAKSIANCLTKNKTLHHLDLSCNNFGEGGSKIIAEGLEPNKKLYGIHFSGNYGWVDPRGFLIMQEKQMTTLHSLVESKINSYEICYNRTAISVAPTQFKNVCWICEGWYEQQFRFLVPQDFKQEKKFVYIHFDFELFAPRLINLNDRNIKYTTMVPPKKYRYFFTFDNQQFMDEKAKTRQLEFSETYTYQMYHEQQTFTVSKASQRKGKPKKMVNDWKQVTINTLPRNTGLVSKKEKQIWTYPKSIWAKEWKLDNDQMLKKCFQRDWKATKLMNLVKNQTDQDKVREKLCQNYKYIKQIYRYFSSWNPVGDIWAVSNNPWTEFCQQAKIVNKQCPLKITDLTFITTNSMSGADWKGNQLVPERGLIRFQFMEALVRLAEEKFKKNGLTENFIDSINMMLKDHILPLAFTLHHEKWRNEKYFVEENDILIKKYRNVFSYIYRKNSKAKVKPGQKSFMCLNEFKSIIERANLAGNYIIERDIYVSFNESMMTQVDQIENERFMKMSQIEFIQALARCAQLLPSTCSMSEIGKKENNQPVHYRFEWLINELKATQCNEDIKGQFPQTTSLFDEIEED